MRSEEVNHPTFLELHLKTYNSQANVFRWFGSSITLLEVKGLGRSVVYKNTYRNTEGCVIGWVTCSLNNIFDSKN